MPTATIHDPASVEAAYGRDDFERDARLNADDKTTVHHGLAILSTPDAEGRFALAHENRHVGDADRSTHSLFVYPTLPLDDWADFSEDGKDHGVPAGDGAATPPVKADAYRAFLEEVLDAARNAHFPPEVPAEALKGFRGG